MLMQEKGFAGMSARELAHSLDFSKANFFYHVRNKEEILYQIFVETLEYFLSGVEEVLGHARQQSGEAACAHRLLRHG